MKNYVRGYYIYKVDNNNDGNGGDCTSDIHSPKISGAYEEVFGQTVHRRVDVPGLADE